MTLIKPMTITLKRFAMNKTEQRFAAILGALRMQQTIECWSWQPEKFILTHKPEKNYTPDFRIIHKDWIEFIEVKGGYVREDAMATFLMAAELNPWYQWTMVQWKNKAWKIIREIGGRPLDCLTGRFSSA